jgi:hypothetical protein
MVVEKMSIQVLLEQTKTKLKEQVKNIDVFENWKSSIGEQMK